MFANAILPLILIGVPVALIVLCIKKLKQFHNAPKESEKVIEKMGNLKGEKYSDIKALLGSPKREITNSNGKREVIWVTDNGWNGTIAHSAFIVTAIFDGNGICEDYEKEIQKGIY